MTIQNYNGTYNGEDFSLKYGVLRTYPSDDVEGLNINSVRVWSVDDVEPTDLEIATFTDEALSGYDVFNKYVSNIYPDALTYF